MKLAILKPDHLGDLILSVPAIRAMAEAVPDCVLFVASRNLALARYLFPELDLRAADLPHLQKAGSGATAIPDFRDFDLVAVLRRDGVVEPHWAQLRMRQFIMPVDSHADHQSVLDFSVAAPIAGPYDLDRLFYGPALDRVRRKAVADVARVGLSIGSGFHANSWPPLRWVETARTLMASGREVAVICGPAERQVGELIVRQLGLDVGRALIVGGMAFDVFLEAIDGLDLVIASDGGTAHLCSLVTPVLSLFGPSPFRRYAPYGPWNRLLTLELPCSPCCQYHSVLVNGCLSVECMTALDSGDVALAMQTYVPATPRADILPLPRGRSLYIGTSHLGREEKLAERWKEAQLVRLPEI